MRGDEVLWILDQLLLRQPVDPTSERGGAREGEEQSGGAFGERVQTLRDEARLEELVDASLVQGIEEKALRRCPGRRRRR